MLVLGINFAMVMCLSVVACYFIKRGQSKQENLSKRDLNIGLFLLMATGLILLPLLVTIVDPYCKEYSPLVVGFLLVGYLSIILPVYDKVIDCFQSCYNKKIDDIVDH
jgi:uncharacterized protein YqgC (DUF456 family)